MAAKAGWCTPMLHASSIEESIKFYERLGFEVIDTDRCTPLGWARIHHEGGAIMFLRAEHEIDPKALFGVMLIMYTADLKALREQLVAAGVKVSEVRYPPWMPSGNIGLRDPDGYLIEVNHWGEKEHAEWLAGIGRSPEVKG
jgi:catechol 2,3-dioxygenase-like lactoylglutathione lyase family enzyme